MADHGHILAELPLLRRLALAYALPSVRTATLGLLAIDARLAGVVRAAREPMLGQLRLGWWRDVLARPCQSWPDGEPLLGLLRAWDGETAALSALVDGWEEMLDEAPLSGDCFVRLAEARAAAFAALARLAGCMGEGERRVGAAAWEWAIRDLAVHVSHPLERDVLARLASEAGTAPAGLPRALRPLLVLRGLGRRVMARPPERQKLVPSDMLFAMRLGLLGR